MVAPNDKTSRIPRTVRFRITRQDAPGKPTRVEEFDVPVETGANVISALQWIAAHPVTVDGARTTPVVYDSGCLEEVCGACTMVINGGVRQSCTALIDDIVDPHGVVTLEPMSSFPTVRDLAVDRARLFAALESVRAWVPIDGTYDLGAGPMESPKVQLTRYQLSQCMSCGCCLEACPQFNLKEDETEWQESFIGPHAISQARLFNLHETGKILADERVDAISGIGGVSDCGNAQNCVKVCPKEIPLTESIAEMGRAVTVRSIRKFFAG
ncbi:MAG: succinate dehydrogenase iron-sulfur subunit [Planctomycetaceae bacterium]|nr:succinate dehydrogenase iron-sulfur subunit [Planctomycetaceae bacterium]